MVAIPITTRRFGPSGSLKNENIILENAIDVIPKIRSELFFELKYIFAIILENLLSETCVFEKTTIKTCKVFLIFLHYGFDALRAP